MVLFEVFLVEKKVVFYRAGRIFYKHHFLVKMTVRAWEPHTSDARKNTPMLNMQLCIYIYIGRDGEEITQESLKICRFFYRNIDFNTKKGAFLDFSGTNFNKIN